MPDPQRDIAPIIEPLAPPTAPAGPDYALPFAVAIVAMLAITVLVWHWRRREPLRQLRKLAHAPDPIKSADALAALVSCYPITPTLEWQSELERLRFGSPADDAAGTLSRLCRTAESFLQAR